MKSIFLFAIFFAPVSVCIAQNTSPFWSLAGNSNASATSKLGTTNVIPLRFFTNNIERLRLGTDGRLGLGTTVPLNIFSVKANGSNPATSWVPNTPVFTGFAEDASTQLDLSTASNTPDLRPVFAGKRSRGTLAAPKIVANNDYISSFIASAYDGGGFLSPAAINFYVDGTPTGGHVPARISFETGTSRGDRLERLKILNNGDFDFNSGQVFLQRLTGNLGIGTSSPTDKFQVNGSSSFTGNVGIGTTALSSYKVKISHGTFGVNIENATTLDDWELWSNSSGLSLYANGAFRGNFNLTTGAYTSVSDERLKTNIKPMIAMLDKIMQLKPSIYQFKNTTDKQEYNGFIAQDVLKIFPAMVIHNVNSERNLDVYTLDYTGFGVIAIKGIQELQPIIEEQKLKTEALENEYKLKISTLENRIARLEAALAKISGNSADVPDLSLQQNTPNPFSKNTTIRYSIPVGSKGQIIIYDLAGKLVKSLQANTSGRTELSGYDLPTGTYTYTLNINGKAALSKQMLIIK